MDTIKTVHINCDVGEGNELDKDFMPFISSCNIACGGHAGNRKSIQKTILHAQHHQVSIGAHPSYPDKKNFGRKSMELPPQKLLDSLCQQLEAFYEEAMKANMPVHHIKPHGALYHDVAIYPAVAELFLRAIASFTNHTLLFTAPHSILKKPEISPYPYWVEAFADRAYTSNGHLVSRAHLAAVLSTPEEVSQQVLQLVLHQEIPSLDGKKIHVPFDTLCFHSDTLHALSNVTYVYEVLSKNHLTIKKDDV